MEVEVIEVYRTDPLRYHRSLVIYLNELSQYEPTSHVSSSRWIPKEFIPSHALCIGEAW